MKVVLLLALAIVVVAGGMKLAGMRLPIVDYPIGIFDGRGPAMPDVQIEAPGFGDFPAP